MAISQAVTYIYLNVTLEVDTHSAANGPFRLGDWLVEPRLNRLTRDNEPIQIELKMMDVLVCLAEHAGELVERQQLIDTVWKTDFVSENILTRAIAELRNVLGDDSRDPSYIETIHRRGYRLIAPVQRSAEESDNFLKGRRTSKLAAGGGQRYSPKQGKKERRWLYILAVVLAAAIAILVILPPGSLIDRLTGTLDKPLIRSIAVLPLVDISGEPGQEIFADGMTDALITELAKFGGFDRVISRTSIMQLKGTELSMPEIAEILGVDGVLEGSVQPVDQRIRISVQLIHAPSDRNVWADRYDRDYSQILTLQSEVAAAVAQAVMVSVTPSESTTSKPRQQIHKEAYEAYLLGQHYLREGSTYEDFSTSLNHYRRAIEIDPEFAPAYLGVSGALRYIAYRYRPSSEIMPEAYAAALQALELDESSAKTHVALGRLMTVWLWDWPGAEAEFKRALELSPNSAYAHHLYGALLSYSGRFDEALALLDRALELNPLSRTQLSRRGRILSLARRYDDAIESHLDAIRLYPNSASFHRRLASTYGAIGRHDKALSAIEKAKEFHPNPEIDPSMLLAELRVFVRAQKNAEADAVLRRLLQLNESQGVAPGLLAIAFSIVGDIDNAIIWLETAYDERDTQMILMKVSSAFDPLRSDPRFQDILHRMRFPKD